MKPTKSPFAKKQIAQALLFLAMIAVAVTARPVPAEATVPDDPAQLEAFLDGFFASAMKEYHVPGLVFVMVRGDRIFLAKGYGYADLETRRRVDPETTLFRVASVSKLFTSTAVMQLLQEGKLDMHRDVNAYLDGFQIPATFPEPITLHHLLTHTAGFDEYVFGMAARRPEDMLPMKVFLAKHLPRRSMAPGDVFSYSNYGLALAGLIVEQVSGQPFEEYVKANVLQPLSMNHSGFRLSPEMAPNLAVGYFYSRHAYHISPYDYLQQEAPAGALLTTGTDIANFMLAHLHGGRFGDTRILSEETARLMHAQHFTHHPKLSGRAYGFNEDTVNGRRLIGHGGNWRGFTTRMLLDQDADLGFFISYNALSSAGVENGLHMDFVQAFYDQYFPTTPESVAAGTTNFAPPISAFAGSYRHNRYMRDCFGKLAALVSEWRVTAGDDGSLTVHPPSHNREPIRLIRVEPLLFQSDDGKGFVAFREGAGGQITHMFLEDFGPGAFDKLSLLESAPFQFILIGVIIALFVSAIIGWPLAYCLRRPRPVYPAWAHRARWFAATTILLFLSAFAVTGIELSGDTYEYSYGVPTSIVFLLVVNHLTVILAIGVAFFAAVAWRKRWWTLAARLHYSAVAIAALALIPFLVYWRLIAAGF